MRKHKRNVNHVWVKILGIQKGMKVKMKKQYWKKYPYLHFGKNIVPTKDFVGIVEGEVKTFSQLFGEKCYAIRQIKGTKSQCVIWDEKMIELV